MCYFLQTSQTSGHNISKRTSSCKVRTRTFLRRDAMHAALFSRFFCPSLSWPVWTRSQSVAKLADRTASQHLSGFCDVIGNLTIWFPVGHFLLVVVWNRAFVTDNIVVIGCMSRAASSDRAVSRTRQLIGARWRFRTRILCSRPIIAIAEFTCNLHNYCRQPEKPLQHRQRSLHDHSGSLLSLR